MLNNWLLEADRSTHDDLFYRKKTRKYNKLNCFVIILDYFV